MNVIRKNDVRIIEIELNCICQLRCKLCFRNIHRFKQAINQNQVDLELLCKKLDEFPYVQQINLNGLASEPTLYPNLLSLISYAKGRNIVMNIYTNGQLHDDDLWNKLRDSLSLDDSVFFTVCGSSQAMHETYRHNSSLKQQFANLNLFKSSLCNDVGLFIRFKYNENDINEAIHKYASLFSRYELIDTIPVQERFNVVNQDLFNLPGEMHYKYIEMLSNVQHKDHLDIRCSSCDNNSVVIDNFCKVYPCYCAKLHNMIVAETKDSIMFADDAACCVECSKPMRDFMNSNKMETFYEC